jgi:4-hydroxy-4-methyl-2-oxoglutarate aldolase
VYTQRVTEFRRPSADIIHRYKQLPTSDLAGGLARALDALGIAGTIPASRLQPILPGRVVIGPAFTIRNIPEREVPYRRWTESASSSMGERDAFFLVQPGDVPVIDGSTVFPASCLGSVAVTVAGRLGAEGVIVSGAVTGVPGIRTAGYPVWARSGTTVTGHHRLETIEINGPIGVEGVRVEPGDLIVADDSGVTVIPCNLAETALEILDRMSIQGQEVRRLLNSDLDREALRLELSRFMANLSKSRSES